MLIDPDGMWESEGAWSVTTSDPGEIAEVFSAMASGGFFTVDITENSGNTNTKDPDESGGKDDDGKKKKSDQNNGGTGNQEDRQKPQMASNGELTLTALLGQYGGRSGGEFILSKSTFDAFIEEMQKDGRIHLDQGKPVPSVKGLYQTQVSSYGTPYENAVGTATLYFNGTGIVGYSDYWNFDHKPSGGRSAWGEAKTRIGSAIPGVPFYVLYGIRPTNNNIPHD